MTNYEYIKSMSREQLAAILATAYLSGVGEFDGSLFKTAYEQYLEYLNAEMELTI